MRSKTVRELKEACDQDETNGVSQARRQLVWLVAVVVVEATKKNTTTREAVKDTAGRDDAGRNDRMPIERTMRRTANQVKRSS